VPTYYTVLNGTYSSTHARRPHILTLAHAPRIHAEQKRH